MTELETRSQREIRNLNTATARRADRLVKDIIQCVSRAPIPSLTDIQVTQLRVLVGMALREQAHAGMWCQARRQEHADQAAIELAAARADSAPPTVAAPARAGWDDEPTEVMPPRD